MPWAPMQNLSTEQQAFIGNTNADYGALKGTDMWYFTWVLGVGFAVLLAIMNAMWGENQEAREDAVGKNE